MDIYCVKCGEPWTMEELHTVLKETRTLSIPYEDAYNNLYRAFKKDGCKALGGKCDVVVDSEMAFAARVMYELSDNTPDGDAAMLEDYAWMFGKDENTADTNDE